MKLIETVSVYKGVAVIAGPRTSFLDHIMPLVHHWNIPLLCTDPWVYTCAQLFYPSTELIFANQETFQDILSNYHTIITVEPCRLHDQAMQFGEFLYRGRATVIAGFHGNPLKFRTDYWIERYVYEDSLLVYGDFLLDYLREKGVLERVNNLILIGNMRKRFYENNKAFFDGVAACHLFGNRVRKTIFWAPTWSYPQAPDLSFLDSVPEAFQIIVKLHPFMFRLFPEHVAELREKYNNSDQILFLDEIPLIYPLIEQADIYLGDSSSVACDFLSLDRPLFLCGAYKAAWAKTIDDGTPIFAALEEIDTRSQLRKQAYKRMFT